MDCLKYVCFFWKSVDNKKDILLLNAFFYIGAIQDMTYSQLTSTHCITTWNPPFQYMQYGGFDGYIVMCNISNTNAIITSDTTQELMQL